MTGTILNITERLVNRTLDAGVTQEVQVIVQASFEWKDLHSGRIIRKRSSIQATGEYIPTRDNSKGVNFGEPFEVGRNDALSKLSREIVEVMGADW